MKLENNLFKVEHKLTKEQFEKLALKVNREDFEKIITTELMRLITEKLMEKITIKTSVKDDHTLFQGEGYFFTELEFMEFCLELVNNDEFDRNVIANNLIKRIEEIKD